MFQHVRTIRDKQQGLTRFVVIFIENYHYALDKIFFMFQVAFGTNTTYVLHCIPFDASS